MGSRFGKESSTDFVDIGIHLRPQQWLGRNMPKLFGAYADVIRVAKVRMLEYWSGLKATITLDRT